MKPLFLQHFVPKETQVHADRVAWYFNDAHGNELIVTKYNEDQHIDKYAIDWGGTDEEVEYGTAFYVYQQVELLLLNDERPENRYDSNQRWYNDRADTDEF